MPLSFLKLLNSFPIALRVKSKLLPMPFKILPFLCSEDFQPYHCFLLSILQTHGLLHGYKFTKRLSAQPLFPVFFHLSADIFLICSVAV